MNEKEYNEMKSKQEAAGSKGEEGGGGDNSDHFKNLKGEFNRKLGNTDEKIQSLIDSQKQIEAAIISLAQPKQKASNDAYEEDLSDLIYSDPKAAINKITEQVRGEVFKEVESRDTYKQQQAETLGQLNRDYPELSNPKSELTKEAVKIFSGMSEAEQTSPMGYKVAIREAAANQGLLPANKRADREDGGDDNDYGDFTMPGNTSSYKKQRSNTQGRSKVSPQLVELAQRLGIIKNDGSKEDKATLDRLKKNQGKGIGQWS